ncbi:MAG: hypothetical protein K2J89_03735 [Clostridia bacterium]|nr:hypothetical protein [Clostridia bacterium]
MMKVFRIFILCFIIVCLVVVGGTFVLVGNDCAYAQTEYADDSSIHIVNDFLDLVAIASDVNNGKYDGYYGVTFTLARDLNIEESCLSFDNGTGWIPIGTTLYPFKGTFDGNGHSINGLYINKTDCENVGLFGVANINATIKNLTVQGSVKGGNYTGGIVGYSQALIENCINLVSISAQDEALHIGGIAGYNYGEITKSKNYGKVRVGFSTFVGGVVGSNLGTISQCYNGEEIISTDSVVGGISGNNIGSIEMCLNSGGIVGKSIAGGIAGNNQGLIKNTFSRCLVDSVNGSSGGIVGSNESTGEIYYAIAVCNVEGLDDVASVCGYNMGVVSNAFYDDCVSSRSIVNGLVAENSKGLTTRLMAHENTLESINKLYDLTEDNSDFWIKRKSADGFYFYPELKYFFEYEQELSTQVSKGVGLVLPSEEIFLEATSFDYDGERHEIGIAFNDLCLELGQDYYATYTDNLNSGSQKMNIEFSGVYAGTISKDFNIIKSELEVQWDKNTFYYDGQIHSPRLMIVNGLIGDEEVEFEYLTPIAIRAGEYEIIAELSSDTAANRNYELPLTKIKYNVLQASLTIGWSDEKFIYSGQRQTPTATVLTGIIGDENITISYEYYDNINAGEQKIKAYLAETETNANYQLNADTYTYFIEKKSISVIWEDTEFYFNGSAQFPKIKEYFGNINGDALTFIYSEYSNNINANENNGYYVTVALDNTETNRNYVLSETECYYSIYRTPLEIDWWDTPLIYSGQPQCPNCYIKSGIIGNDEILLEFSDYSDNVNACEGNSYKVEITLANTAVNANYILPETVKNYGISKADFVPTRDVVFNSKTFGYDGEPKSIFIESALPNGISVEYENNGRVDIGQYLVTAKFSVDTQNYIPLKTNAISATMSIAQMVFVDEESNIIATIKDDAIYGLSFELTDLENATFKQRGKKLLTAFSSSLENGIVEYKIPLEKKIIEEKELYLFYKTAAGEVVATDYEIDGDHIIFIAEDAIELAIYVALDLTWLWISLGGIGIIGVIIAVFLICKKKRLFKKTDDVSNVVSESKTDTCDTLQFNTEIDDNVATEIAEEINEKKIDVIKEKSFYLDGIYCLSYEWFIKSLSVKTADKQKRICAGDYNAELLKESISHNTVYWQGKRYRVYSASYENLIKRAKEATHENN